MILQFCHSLIIGPYIFFVLLHVLIVLFKLFVILFELFFVLFLVLITFFLLRNFNINSINLTFVILLNFGCFSFNLCFGFCYTFIHILFLFHRNTQIFCGLYSLIQFCSIHFSFNTLCGICTKSLHNRNHRIKHQQTR